MTMILNPAIKVPSNFNSLQSCYNYHPNCRASMEIFVCVNSLYRPYVNYDTVAMLIAIYNNYRHQSLISETTSTENDFIQWWNTTYRHHLSGK